MNYSKSKKKKKKGKMDYLEENKLLVKRKMGIFIHTTVPERPTCLIFVKFTTKKKKKKLSILIISCNYSR